MLDLNMMKDYINEAFDELNISCGRYDADECTQCKKYVENHRKMVIGTVDELYKKLSIDKCYIPPPVGRD